MAERLYSFAELTEIGSELYALGDEGKKAAAELVERTHRLLMALPEEERQKWVSEASKYQ